MLSGNHRNLCELSPFDVLVGHSPIQEFSKLSVRIRPWVSWIALNCHGLHSVALVKLVFCVNLFRHKIDDAVEP